MSMSRDELIAYFNGRTDHPVATRKAITAKIRAASDESIRRDKPCEGKHWWLMDFDTRNVCPYCGWKLTRV